MNPFHQLAIVLSQANPTLVSGLASDIEQASTHCDINKLLLALSTKARNPLITIQEHEEFEDSIAEQLAKAGISQRVP